MLCHHLFRSFELRPKIVQFNLIQCMAFSHNSTHSWAHMNSSKKIFVLNGVRKLQSFKGRWNAHGPSKITIQIPRFKRKRQQIFYSTSHIRQSCYTQKQVSLDHKKSRIWKHFWTIASKLFFLDTRLLFGSIFFWRFVSLGRFRQLSLKDTA